MRRSPAVDPRDAEIESLKRRLSDARQDVIQLSRAPDHIVHLSEFAWWSVADGGDKLTAGMLARAYDVRISWPRMSDASRQQQKPQNQK
jgi:hypothetical protein